MVEFLAPGNFFIWISIGLLILLLAVIIIPDFLSLDLTSDENTHLQQLQSLGQLSTSIAHDFNNILTAIIGNSELLIAQYAAQEPALQGAREIKTDALRGAQLVKQLLFFGRKSPINPVHCNVATLINDLQPLLKQILPEQYRLVVDHNNDDTCVIVDPIQLEQIIINLVTNARDAMTQGGTITIHSSLRYLSDHAINALKQQYFLPPQSNRITPKYYVQVVVRDNGSGIAADIMGNIFAPFFSTKDIEGTGLGLATVLQVVEKINGHILVKSQAREGTNFLILLPQADNLLTKYNSKTFDHAIEQSIGQGHNVLLVDDDKSILTLASHALKNLAFSVIAVDNAQDAATIIADSTNKIDVLMTDVNLGAGDGFELAAMALQKDPEMKVVITSGHEREYFLQQLEQHNYHFLNKPYSLQELHNLIRDILAV